LPWYFKKEGEVCKTENFITKGCLRSYTIDENDEFYLTAIPIIVGN
jgi:hypothetical protein